MSASYSEIPAGGIVNIPASIPTGMLYRVKSLAGISKQTLKLVPLIPERPDSAFAEKSVVFSAFAEN